MQKQWSDDQPIYRQLRDQIISLILAGDLVEGEAIPSVRSVSADYQINHLTVSKAYQALVDEGVVEKRRGLGMFVIEGAKERILQSEKQNFLNNELPKLTEKLALLGISKEELIQHLDQVFAANK